MLVSDDQEMVGMMLHKVVPYIDGADLDFVPDFAQPFFGAVDSTMDKGSQQVIEALGLHMLLGIYIAHKWGLDVDVCATEALAKLDWESKQQPHMQNALLPDPSTVSVDSKDAGSVDAGVPNMHQVLTRLVAGGSRLPDILGEDER